MGSGRTVNAGDPKTCQYRGYRNGPNDKDPYGLSPHYWHVFAARLAFVVVFEVLLINQLIKYIKKIILFWDFSILYSQ